MTLGQLATTGAGTVFAVVVADSSFRMILRAETATDHARVDALVERSASVADTDGARRFFTVMHAVVAAHRTALDRSSVLAGIEPRSAQAMDALRSDLAELGVDVPSAPAAIEQTDDAGALGIGYVLEGSALGASVLRGQAEVASTPLGYLSLLDDERPARWPAFSSGLNRFAADNLAVDGGAIEPTLQSAAIEAARQVFLRVEAELASLIDNDAGAS